MKKAVIINQADNVSTVLDNVDAGEKISCKGLAHEIIVDSRQNIPLGHKIAIKDIPKGRPVVKYGFDVGFAKYDIKQGEHVHVHNVGSLQTEG